MELNTLSPPVCFLSFTVVDIFANNIFMSTGCVNDFENQYLPAEWFVDEGARYLFSCRHGVPFPCYLCEHGFESKTALLEHYREVHCAPMPARIKAGLPLERLDEEYWKRVNYFLQPPPCDRRRRVTSSATSNSASSSRAAKGRANEN